LLLAKKLDVPAVIHNRNADEDLLSIVKEISPRKAVIHCFSSDVAVAKRAIKAGCHLSFTGNITFGNNHTESVLRVIPIEKIMLETDCPFLAPVPNRGKLNEPSNIPHIAKKIAEIKEIELGDVANLTSTTAQNFFGLPY
jgi:TatD DNase family protein